MFLYFQKYCKIQARSVLAKTVIVQRLKLAREKYKLFQIDIYNITGLNNKTAIRQMIAIIKSIEEKEERED
jgi:hypothetical protein